MILQRMVWRAAAFSAAAGMYGCLASAPDWDCRTDKPCPEEGDICLSINQSAPRCYAVCRVASNCSPGEGCSEAEGVCLAHGPECTDHHDCWAGFRCDRDGSKQCVKCDNNGRDPSCRDPMAPAGLAATADVEKVWLTWQPVDGAASYRVYMSDSAGVTEDDEVLGSAADTAYLHDGAEPGRTHYYRVSAVNEWSEGPLSHEALAEPLAPATPGRPTHVAATPGNQRVVVAWDPVDGAEGYRLYHRVAADTYGDPIDAESPYSHAGLTNGATYFYRVSAHNAGGEGLPSVEVSATPGVAVDDAPQNLTAMPGDGVVTLSWDPVESAGSYTVYWAEAPGVTRSSGRITISQPCQSAPCSYEHGVRVNDTTYYYRVSANTNPALSLEVSATPSSQVVASPSALFAEQGNTEVTLTWESVRGVASYELFWDTESGVTETDNCIPGIVATEYTHEGLANGTTYYYRVRGRIGGATSDLSNEAFVTPNERFETQAKLVASGVGADHFGWSVAMSGNTLVVGATHDWERGNAAGAAYVFERSDRGKWTERTKLTGDDTRAGDWFGQSVAISGNALVVGTLRDGIGGDQAGAAYLFERSDAGEWTQRPKLTPADVEAGDWFGMSVAISGNTLVVGAPKDDDKAGAAYAFERSDTGEWSQSTRLTATDAEAGDWFGHSVAISGNALVAGAHLDGDGGSDAGAAYVLERSGPGKWTERTKLTATDAEADAWFGMSVAISGDGLVVGAYGDDDGGSDAGAAYVFERSDTGEWTQRTKLTASDAEAGDRFGVSVAISGNTLVVGAEDEDDGGSNAGAAYVFERSDTGEWTQRLKLTAADAEAGDAFGCSVAISNNHLAVGAFGKDSDTGACYAF